MLKGLLGSYTLAARLVAPERGSGNSPPHRVMLADAAPKEGRRLGAHSATIMTAYTNIHIYHSSYSLSRTQWAFVER